MSTFEQSKELVKEKIHGFRKGTENFPDPIPNYLHSWKVYEALKTYGFDQDTQMAGLLHDIIEDGGMTLNELRELGYSDDILHLVDLATHDMTIHGSFEKRKKMLQRLIEEDNKDARAIKLTDISDNLLECHLMPDKEKLNVFLNKKCPVFLYYGNKYFGGTEFYNEFIERYFNQIKLYNQYFLMKRIQLEPLFRHLGITEASTPDEIRAIAKALTESAENEFDMTEGFRTEPLSDEINAAMERFNRGEFDDDEMENSISQK